MIKENQRILNILNVLSDSGLVLCAMLLAYAFRFFVFDGTESMPLTFYIWSALIISLLFILLFGALGLYESQRTAEPLRTLQQVVLVSLICTALLATVFFTSKKVDVSRWLLALFFLFSSLLLSLKRVFLKRLLLKLRAQGYNQKYTLLVGSGRNGRDYLEALRAHPELGYQVLGSIGLKPVSDSVPYLGGFDQLETLLSQTAADELVAALDLNEFEYMDSIVAASEKSGLLFSLIPYFSSYMLARPHIDEVGSVPLVNLRRIPLDNLVNHSVKRLMDIVGSLLLMAITSPLLLLAAAGTYLTLGRPIIFRQTRVGYRRKDFTMLKFRSMRAPKPGDQSGWSAYDAGRLTRFGRFLRKTSMDELPQLLNVLRGEMSLVGPRPELPQYVGMFRESVPLYMVKHQVRPGITGLAQVKGYRGDTSIEARIHCDIEYIENWTVLLDLKILLMTIFHFMENGENVQHEQCEQEQPVKRPSKQPKKSRAARKAARAANQDEHREKQHSGGPTR